MVNFRTTYINVKTGGEVTQSKRIAVNYLKNYFVIDVLATFPFD